MQSTSMYRSISTVHDVRRRSRQLNERKPKRYLKHLSCRAALHKVQSSTHGAHKSVLPLWVQKQPQLHMVAEMARHPAAPGLLIGITAVQGLKFVSQMSWPLDKVSLPDACFIQPGDTLAAKLSHCMLFLLQGVKRLLVSVVDQATPKAEALGKAITQQLQAASDSAAQQTEISQQSLQVS